MDAQWIGLWGGIAGGVLGGLGGLVGTYFSIKNTNGPRERAFMVRAAAICWLAVSLSLLGMWLTPAPYRFCFGIPQLILLIWGIPTWNRRQAEIRLHEAGGRV